MADQHKATPGPVWGPGKASSSKRKGSRSASRNERSKASMQRKRKREEAAARRELRFQQAHDDSSSTEEPLACHQPSGESDVSDSNPQVQFATALAILRSNQKRDEPACQDSPMEPPIIPASCEAIDKPSGCGKPLRSGIGGGQGGTECIVRLHSQ